jgi:hypothetical protein
MPILSSQTQGFDIQPLKALTDLPPAVPIFKLPPLPEYNISRRITVVADSDEIIHSSQSQHLLPHHISPRQKCDQKFVHSYLAEPTFEEMVPSSQSQTEMEINMSMRVLDCFTRGKPGIRVGCVSACVVCTLINMWQII